MNAVVTAEGNSLNELAKNLTLAIQSYEEDGYEVHSVSHAVSTRQPHISSPAISRHYTALAIMVKREMLQATLYSRSPVHEFQPAQPPED